MDHLHTVINVLASGGKLDRRYKQHLLKGKYSGFWECHIEPDWLLVYKITEFTLYLADTGTHADLFK